jgi:hypothetical protein
MTEMNTWTFLASIFCSISLFGSALDAVGNSALLAGAGNPQAIERTLVNLAGHMGLTPAAPVPAPAADGAAVELKQTEAQKLEELDPVADWLSNEGKDKVCPEGLAKLLGLSGEFKIKQKSYLDDSKMVHVGALSAENGRDMVFARVTTDNTGYYWRTDRTGKLLTTVRNDATSSYRVDNSEAAEQFKAQKKYFIGKVPATEVASTGLSGTN